MKNLKLAGLVVFFVFAGIIMSSCAARVGQGGYDQPLIVRAEPLKKTEVTSAEKALESSALDKKIDRLTKAMDKMAQALEGQKPWQVPAKKPRPGIFSQQLAEVAKKEAAVKKKPRKKIYRPSYQAGEFAKLKYRMARLEEIVEFEHPGSDIMSVLYGPAKGFLDTKAKARTKRYYEYWLDGKLDMKGSNSYASKPPPRNPELTNKMISQLRSQELRNFLKELGMPEEELAKMKWQFLGPTDRFPDGKISTLIIEWITDKTEIEKRRIEREKYKKPPMK